VISSGKMLPNPSLKRIQERLRVQLHQKHFKIISWVGKFEKKGERNYEFNFSVNISKLRLTE